MYKNPFDYKALYALKHICSFHLLGEDGLISVMGERWTPFSQIWD